MTDSDKFNRFYQQRHRWQWFARKPYTGSEITSAKDWLKTLNEIESVMSLYCQEKHLDWGMWLDHANYWLIVAFPSDAVRLMFLLQMPGFTACSPQQAFQESEQA